MIKQRELRQARLPLYREALLTYKSIFEDLLRSAAPITENNIDALEQSLIEEEVRIGADLILQLNQLAPFPEEEHAFVHQSGATCMSTSVTNGMIALKEPFFKKKALEKTRAFTDHIVQNTSSFGKPHEYRSIDDMHKYLKRNEQQEFSKFGESISRRYHVELTNSLIEAIMALHSGDGRVVVQQHAHANLAFEIAVLEEHGQADIFIRQRDPFTTQGSDSHRLIPLLEWRQHYLWSPLKKIPSSMGRGFESLSANEVLEHLARYSEMDNLGIECISGILIPFGE
ncbi:MAG: hypothetical protein P1V97_24175 [Planctomycetota bacterium]|nr:hypothetical protein [Planctomycetota bacterium]